MPQPDIKLSTLQPVPHWLAALARAAYSMVMVAAVPLLRRRIARRGRAEPVYLQSVAERFGHYAQPGSDDSGAESSPPRDGPLVWLHAVSLGETRAAAVLLEAMRAQWPDMRLLLTHGTATGRSAGEGLLAAGDRQCWLPWDTPTAAQAFLRHWRPDLGVLIETEVWPNLVAACAQAGVPLVLANARLNEQSWRKAQRLRWLAQPAYGALAAVLAQGDADARRLRELGATVTAVTGNLKFDMAPNDEQLVAGRQWGRLWRQRHQRAIVMLASSRATEERMLLEAIAQLKPQAPPVQWLIVPRHPQRFDEVAELVVSCGHHLQRLSALRADGALPNGDLADPAASPTVWLGDSVGEMAFYYGLADIALLGGSFAPLGGQNLIEAAACGCPVVMGPHTFNFAEPAELAEASGAAIRVADMRAGVETADALAHQPTVLRQAHRAAEAFVSSRRGAARRTAQACAALL